MSDKNDFGRRVEVGNPTQVITYSKLDLVLGLRERVCRVLDEDGYQLYPCGRLTTGEEEFWTGFGWDNHSPGYTVGLSSCIFRRKKSYQP